MRRLAHPVIVVGALAFALGAVACSALVSLDGLSSGGGADASPSPLEAGVDSGDGGSDGGSVDAALDALRPYVDEVRADAPASYWRLGETEGAAKDEQGKYPGTYGGSGELGRPGAIRGDSNTAAEFLGGTITFPGAYAFEGRAPFSVEMWVMPAVVDGIYRHFFRRVADGATRTGHLLWVHNEGLAFERDLGYADGVGVQEAAMRTAGLPVNAWSHVVATYDGSTMRLYLDGREVDSAPSAISLTSTGSAFVLGEGYLGKMDEVAVYARALPADRVLVHYKAAGY